MLLKSQKESGFTLIELLVVIIIVGILSAIALPSFLNQAAKAKQTEAKSYIGAVNRSQQAYRIQNPKFAQTITDLEINLPTATQDYTYSITAINGTVAYVTSDTNETSLRNYAGGVFTTVNGLTAVGTCQTKQVNTSAGLPILDENSEAVCPQIWNK